MLAPFPPPPFAPLAARPHPSSQGFSCSGTNLIGNLLNFHLLLTDRCNLNCTYCRGRALEDAPPVEPEELDWELPPELDYDLGLLYTFLSKDPEATLSFYGGEPLLRMDLVETILSKAPARRFLIQTNGLLLDRLSDSALGRLDTISVSLDGDERLTDTQRGAGTYRRVMENLRKLSERGFSGEVIARMTVTPETNIHEAVLHLARNPGYNFDSIHWQLDADFFILRSLKEFQEWVNRSYNPGIEALVHEWVGAIERDGRVPRWYPFILPAHDLLEGQAAPLRCGCGHASYSIMTNGYIAPCPVMVGMRRVYLGHISSRHPLCLPKVTLNGDCAICSIRDFCGGRCLFAQMTRPWPDAGRRIVCGTVEHLRRCLLGALPKIRRMLGSGYITREDLYCPRYNGCEIIP